MIGSEIFVWRVHTESNLKVQFVNIERMHRSVAFVLFWITGMNQAVCVTTFDQSERVICAGIFALGKSRFEKCMR